ncbi:RAMP superfamily CRISPR-associated protein [uncultured Thiohalocapsa sp.]|uniref:RAMP superfamily CRISPR-associated protein n=1 Tax=uncultured Thiohalocapsa sp. TaxID=768990 RepID=UPI0025DA8FCC|nr:RAMP superfamily CRISPR-associated protein [uncultured Thiohalocapsa sp.]
MNRLDNSVLHIARFTLEARSALSIGIGGPDGVHDHPIVRDANGLAMIPGTSLAGVLRHLWADQGGATAAAELFGHQRRNTGDASRLEVAACRLQDRTGRPVEGLLCDADGERQLRSDPLLQASRAGLDDPLFRDRVRLDHRGVSAKGGKFDRGLAAPGNRFSGELRLWSTRKADPDWARLLRLLADPRLRLGGGTRAGLGAMTLVRLHSASFDLTDAQDIAAFCALGTGLGDLDGLAAQDVAASSTSEADAATLTIQLKPWDFWRFGQGSRALSGSARTADLLPKLEPVVRWQDGRAVIDTRAALAPGSSIKGALAHRTAFHWNALAGSFADDLDAETVAGWDKSVHCDGVRAIFGHAKDRDDSGGARTGDGHAGLVLFEDAHIELPIAEVQAHLHTMIHNALDRFTGGVRKRMLFTEELIYRKPIALRLTLLPGFEDADALARRAFARALRDLCEGRLALGGGVTKGHGAFTGVPSEATRSWLDRQDPPADAADAADATADLAAGEDAA